MPTSEGKKLCRNLWDQIPAVTYIQRLREDARANYVSPLFEEMLVSPLIEEVFGFTSAEWLSDPGLWFRQIHSDDRERVAAELCARGDRAGVFQLEYRLLARNGHAVWVCDKGVVFRDEVGKSWFAEGILWDISRRKRAELTLQRNEAKFRFIFEKLAVGTALVDMQGRIMESNQALHEMLGYSPMELSRRILAELAHPDDAMAGTHLYRELVTGQSDHYRVEKRFMRKDGGLIWAHLNVSLVQGAEGDPQFTIQMLEDITERKRLESQFLQSQKMETVGRLAGEITHDLNNLLTIVRGYSDLSLAALKEDDPVIGNIEEIKRATERASELTHQLLAVSCRQILDMKVLNLNTLVRNLEKMLRRVLGEGIELNTLLAEDLGTVKGDVGRIEQMILNLVVNAKDAMPTGGKLVIETANVELDAAYARSHVGVIPGRYVKIAVGDTGYGMTSDVMEKIFEPFFTTKEKGKGTGLGLSTVSGLVNQSGGHIWVYSEPGQGTTFKIHLPRVDNELDDLSSPEETRPLPQGHETVLLVEMSRR